MCITLPIYITLSLGLCLDAVHAIKENTTWWSPQFRTPRLLLMNDMLFRKDQLPSLPTSRSMLAELLSLRMGGVPSKCTIVGNSRAVKHMAQGLENKPKTHCRNICTNES